VCVESHRREKVNVCVSVCMCERGKEREERNTELYFDLFSYTNQRDYIKHTTTNLLTHNRFGRQILYHTHLYLCCTITASTESVTLLNEDLKHVAKLRVVETRGHFLSLYPPFLLWER